METAGTRHYTGEVVYANNTGNWEAERERRRGEDNQNYIINSRPAWVT